MGRNSALLNLIIGIAPLALAVVIAPILALAMTAPRLAGALCLGLFVAGFGLFAVAKASRFKAGALMSWGFTGMTPSMRRCYRSGYG